MEKFFVSRPIFALSLAIVIVLVGLISILNLPIEQYPDITPPVVEVSATYDAGTQAADQVASSYHLFNYLPAPSHGKYTDGPQGRPVIFHAPGTQGMKFL